MNRTTFCPYMGLQPFTEAQRVYFFGRERDSRLIVANLDAAKLTVFYGPSGVGKSSVLMAGALPLLHDRPRTAVVVHREWQRADAVAQLKIAIVQEVRRRSVTSTAEMDPDQPLDQLLLNAAEIVGGRIVIILDQFEEYFTYFPSGHEGSLDAELARAVNRTDIDCAFMLSLREDGLSKLDRFRARIANLLENRLRLAHLDRAAAEQAIRGPITRFNELAAAGPEEAISIDDELVDAILLEVRSGLVQIRPPQGTRADAEPAATVATASNDSEIETPFLQLVLTKLWETEAEKGSRALRYSTFHELGHADRIVRNHLDGVMAAQSPELQEVCARFFDRLITPSGSKIALGIDDLVKYARELGDRVPEAVKLLVERRILRAISPPPGRPVQYEIFHDVLAPAAIDWQNRYFRDQAQRAEKAAIAKREIEHARDLLAAQQLANTQRSLAAEERKRSQNSLYFSIGMLGLALLSAITAYFAWHKANEAETQHKVADAARLAADSQAQLEDNPNQALLLATEAVRRSASREATRAVLTAAKRVAMAPLSVERPIVLQGMGERIPAVAFSRDGKVVAVARADGPVGLLDATTGRLIGTLAGTTGPVTSIAFNADGTLVATGGEDQTVRVWNAFAFTGAELPYRGPVTAVEFNPRTGALVIGTRDGTMERWDVVTRARIGTPLKAHGGRVDAIAFSPDGKRMATAANDNTAQIWDLSSAEPKRVGPLPYKGFVKGMAFSPDGNLLATASFDGSVRLWSVEPIVEIGVPKWHGGPVTSVAFSPDGKYAASGSNDTFVKIWDTNTQSEFASLAGHASAVTKVAYSVGSSTTPSLLSASSADGTVIRRDAGNLKSNNSRIASANQSKIANVAFSADGKLVATVNNDIKTTASTIILWDATSHKAVGLLSSPPSLEYYTNVAFSPDGKLIATGSKAGGAAAILWDVELRQMKTHLGDPEDAATCVAFSADGAVLATGLFNSEGKARVKLWDVAGKHDPKVIEETTPGTVTNVAFSPDAKLIAILVSDPSGRETTVALWSASDHQRLAAFESAKDAPITSMAFSPDSKWLATASALQSGQAPAVTLWDVSTGSPTSSKLDGRTGPVTSVAFSADSKLLATAGADGKLELWDVNTRRNTGAKLATGHEWPVNSIAFAPRGQQIAIGLEQPMPVFWSSGKQDWAAVGCSVAARNMSCTEWASARLDGTYRSTCPGLDAPTSCVRPDQKTAAEQQQQTTASVR